MNFSTLDIILFLPILYGLIRGLLRGFARELTSILAIVAGLVASKLWAPTFAVRTAEVVNMPDWVARTLAYVLLFVGVTLLCQLLGRVLQKVLRAISLGWLDKLLGAIFGGMKWALIVSVLLNLLTLADPYYEVIRQEAKQHSRLYAPIHKIASITWDKAKELRPTQVMN